MTMKLYSDRKKAVLAWSLISLEAIFPVIATFSSTVAQAEQKDVRSPSQSMHPSGAFVAAGDNDNALRIADYSSQAGRFLASRPDANAAGAIVQGELTGAASREVEQWLSSFGSARVQLDTDRNLSLKNSQIDLLLPVYDSKKKLLFTQGSLHRTDSRSQINLGAGLRHFTATDMLGGNLFGDYDLSRDHARLGGGVEYWRDFVKLNANGYLRLTSWKNSRDLTDYEERPANGWDIRAQAWVPSLPQLGGRLTYEQYYGKEVALFGVDNRQKNPHAITAGVNYTPIPLLTFRAEQRMGQSGKGDTGFGVDMTYQPGVPWQQQLSPDAVAALRSLTGSRYDLVERNNSIVLEYQKKEVLHLKTAALVTGKAGEQKSLGVSVNSKHGLKHIEWNAGELVAAGGSIVQSGSNHAVVMPAYRSGTEDMNSYTVSGVAVDTKGNRSVRSDTQVTVQAPEINKQNSAFTPVSSELQADGKSTQVLTLTLRDETNRVVDTDVNDIRLESSTLKSAVVSALTRQSAGVYTVTVTAGTDNELVTLTPIASGIALSAAMVNISNVVPDAGQSVFTASPENIIADNMTTSTLTLVVRDAQGNALPGLTDSLAFVVQDSSGKRAKNGGAFLSAVKETITGGTYIATLKGTTAGLYTIVPEYNGSPIGGLSATVTLS
ncbi:invasin, partial [Shigella sonnei]|nr:invasin [Shigella sonnei]